MRIKIAAVLTSAAVGAGALFGYVATLTAATQNSWQPRTEAPWCPTEDSCEPDYDGTQDKWVVVELNP